MWFSILFGLFLIGLAVVMLIRNRSSWHAAQSEEMEVREGEFLHRQYRRRAQATSMIAIVGVAVIVGIWVTDALPDSQVALYWSSVLLVVCWMAVLAVADLVATRRYYGRQLQDQLDQRSVLEAELKQIQRREGNGKPPRQPSEDLK